MRECARARACVTGLGCALNQDSSSKDRRRPIARARRKLVTFDTQFD